MENTNSRPYVNATDELLWKLFVQGNRNALGILYKRYYAVLLNYGLKFCMDEELVKDSIQDIFVKLYTGKKIATSVSPIAYLLHSVKNSIFTKLVSLKDEEELNEDNFHIPESIELFEQLFSQSDEDLAVGRSLLKAISELTSNQKKILYLRYVKELSYKEISEIMNINIQSSMNLVNRSLTKLRLLMGEKKFSLLVGLFVLNHCH